MIAATDQKAFLLALEEREQCFATHTVAAGRTFFHDIGLEKGSV
jgi:hypothetical protein